MLRLLTRRLTVAVPVLFGVTVLVFLILHLIPGDPAQILLFGSRPTPQQIAQLRSTLGLDQPLPLQYLAYLGRLVHGDLGQGQRERALPVDPAARALVPVGRKAAVNLAT